MPALLITDAIAPATAPQWLTQLLALASTVGLPTQSWQSGGITRTIFSALSFLMSGNDALVSMAAQGGFLDFAATGTVTYTGLAGQPVTVPVTPDPSIPSQWPTPGVPPLPGWLDFLADSVYNVQRIGATAATTNIVFTNTTGSPSAPYPPGTYHVANLATGITYSNVNALTIAGTGTTTALFQCDTVGSSGTTGPNTITQPVTSLIGITCTNPSGAVGNDPEPNVRLVNRCRLSIQARSPNAPKGAYMYAALTAFQTLQTLTGLTTPLVGGVITQAQTQLDQYTGIVVTTIANQQGSTNGVANLAVSGCTGVGVSPIVLTVPSTAGLSTGMTVLISAVQGNGAANGYQAITVVDGTHFSLNGTTGNGNYTGGGNVEAGDLGLVDNLIQTTVVPQAVTARTQWATPQNVNVSCTVYVPAAAGATAASTISTALTNYFLTIPIGGFASGVPTPGSVPFNEVLGVIENAVPGTRTATLALNGGLSDIVLGPTSVAVLSPPPAISVQTF